MSDNTAKKKGKQNYFDTRIPPVNSNAYKVNVSGDKHIHISFGWLPPEADEIHILYRVVLTTSTARELANDILKSVEGAERDSEK